MPSSFVVEVHTVFGALIVLTALGYVYTWRRGSQKTTSNVDFKRFQYVYLGGYLLAFLADWLQGPYLYRLYEHYGFLPEQIAVLYICGFSSSMVMGPFLGGMADIYGRRRMSIIFCFVYALSCLLHISSNLFVLMVARLLGGMATSLLFSTFESWMVFTHREKGFPDDWLSQTFSLSTFGNGIVACFAGILANAVAEVHGHHRYILLLSLPSPLPPFFFCWQIPIYKHAITIIFFTLAFV
eukprot:m.42431 g.42431  ORF g.42431 m.42431 type:complete len:240 (+) comp7057_c0_seq4:83-802(+)